MLDYWSASTFAQFIVSLERKKERKKERERERERDEGGEIERKFVYKSIRDIPEGVGASHRESTIFKHYSIPFG